MTNLQFTLIIIGIYILACVIGIRLGYELTIIFIERELPEYRKHFQNKVKEDIKDWICSKVRGF